MWKVVLLVSYIVAAGCNVWSRSARYEHYEKEHDPRQHDYVIGPSDALAIHVWRDSELSSEAVVRPDGTISMPLVGEIRVAGRTAKQVKDEIAQALEAYVRNAVVTVAVTAVNSYRFTVAGEVAHPGVFSARTYVTVSEALALAGGPTRYAKDDEVTLIRTDPDGTTRRIPIDYEGILEGEKPFQNIVVLSGDTLHVP